MMAQNQYLFVNSPLLNPFGIYSMVQSGEIRWSFEYCEFLRASKPKDIRYPEGWSRDRRALIQHDPADVRGMLNAGGEL